MCPISRGWGSSSVPKDAACALSPEDGARALSPKDAACALSSEDGARALAPKDAACALSPEDGARALSPKDAACAPSPEDGARALSPKDGARALTSQYADSVCVCLFDTVASPTEMSERIVMPLGRGLGWDHRTMH